MTPTFTKDISQRFGFGGPRDSRKVIGVAVHTTENDPSTPAMNVAEYQLRTKSGSYHSIVDSKSRIKCNTSSWITWSTGNKGNYILMHIAFVGRASQSRAQWLAQDAMLRNGAIVVASWCKELNIPAKRVTAAGLPGIMGHVDTIPWGSTDHTDPGPNFPYDVFTRMVSEYMGGKPTPNPTPDHKPPMKESVVDNQLQQVWDQLRGPGGQGWQQLGGRSLVDAVAAIGEHLKLDGFKAPKK